MRKGSGGSGDLLDLFLGELASTRPVEYAIVVIVRHEILLSRFLGCLLQTSRTIKNCKMFAKASEQLCIYVAVWVADSAGHKRGQTSGNKATGNLVHFFLGQLPGTHPAEYPIIIIRHKFLLSNLAPIIWAISFVCRSLVDG
jgi:hypothetical protein